MERFEEEVTLVKAESARVARTFGYFATQWEQRAKDWAKKGQKERFDRGAAAASWCRRGVFMKLAELAEADHRELEAHERWEL